MRGHRVALTCLCIAGFVVVLSFAILLWASIRPTWVASSAPSIDTAAVWIALLGVCATVIAIVAAYVELRTLFPAQELRAEARRITYRDQNKTWVLFLNDRASAMINAFRLEVSLVNALGQTVQGDLHERATLDQYNSDESAWVLSDYVEEELFLYTWTLSRSGPFFPGTEIPSPYSPITDDATHWRATWWTDRAGPQEVLLPVPAPGGAPRPGGMVR